MFTIPFPQIADTQEHRAKLAQTLFDHTNKVVEVLAHLQPSEQQAALQMAKHFLLANNARLYDQSVAQANGNMQQVLGGILGHEHAKKESQPVAPWVSEMLNEDDRNG